LSITSIRRALDRARERDMFRAVFIAPIRDQRMADLRDLRLEAALDATARLMAERPQA